MIQPIITVIMQRETAPHNFGNWPNAPASPSFPFAETIHVWRVWLAPLRDDAVRWRTVLCAEENARADRFHFNRDRETWLITRGILRTLLGQYLALSADRIEFHCNTAGKPALRPGLVECDLRFNVSHSGQYSLLAFAAGFDIGVDIECNEGHSGLEQLSPSVFSADDLAIFLRLPSHLRLAAFLAAWTRKEAVLKALGTGLSLSPELLEVTFEPEDTPAIRRGPDVLRPLENWSLRSIQVAEHYSSALAARAPRINLCLWSYPATST